MTKRNEHTFFFKGAEIAAAAQDEASYHEARVEHWEARAEVALVTVKDTIGAKVVEHPVSSGPPEVQIVVDYGDQEAWNEYSLSNRKVKVHRTEAETYRTEARLYDTQPTAVFELDALDVEHFRLNGAPRED